MTLNMFDGVTVDGELILNERQREFHNTYVAIMDDIIHRLTLTNIDVENVVHVFGEDDIIDRPCMVRAIIKVHSFDPVTCELHAANVFPEIEDYDDDEEL